MANDGFSTFLSEMNKGDDRNATMRELAQIFDDVAKTADKVSDIDAKVALKIAAAAGKEKLQKLQRLL